MSTTERLYTLKELPVGRLSIMPRPRGGAWLFDDIEFFAQSGVDVLVSLLTPSEVSELDLEEEASYAAEAEMLFLSYPIFDFSVPSTSDATWRLLTQLHAYLVDDKHVAIHCRMGIGRSALIAASLLVLSGYTPEQACRLLSDVRGRQVPETQEQRQWVEDLSAYFNAQA